MNQKQIYIISVFEKMNTIPSLFSSEEEVADIGCSVINGWYFNKEEAESILKNNTSDIWETCYNYAVLEECNEGMYDYGRVRTYYKYNKGINKYEKLHINEIPKAFLSPEFSISRVGM